MWEHPGWGRAARAGSLGKPGAPRAGASRLAELVLLLLPVAHLEQRFRGCPGIDARPGCQREAAQLLARAVLPAAARAPCRCPATLLAPSLSLCMKILLGQIWDKPSRQHYMVPTAAFTFPVLSCGPAAWHKVSAAPARGSGDSQGGWRQWQRGGRGAGSAWPPVPDSCQTSAAGGSCSRPALVEKQPSRKVRARVSLPSTGCLLGWGTLIRQGGAVSVEPRALLALPCSLQHGMAWHSTVGRDTG